MTTSGLPRGETEIGEDEADEIAPPPAEGLAALLFTLVAVALLAIAPLVTRLPPAGRGWYLAPVTWPAACLGLTVISGAVLSWRLWRGRLKAPDPSAYRRETLWAFGGMREALEYSFWFCLYLLGISHLGFAIATLAFLQFIVWRAGLRGRRWVLITLCIAVAIIAIFRLGIGLWFPLPPLFLLFPAWFANTFGGVL